MIIETKYGFGDKVWSLFQVIKSRHKTCGFCGGDGKVTGNDGNIQDCPVCYGSGDVLGGTTYRWQVEGPKEIIGVAVTKTNHPVSNSEGYYCDRNMFAYNVNTLFLLEKDALAECARWNAESES